MLLVRAVYDILVVRLEMPLKKRAGGLSIIPPARVLLLLGFVRFCLVIAACLEREGLRLQSAFAKVRPLSEGIGHICPRKKGLCFPGYLASGFSILSVCNL